MKFLPLILATGLLLASCTHFQTKVQPQVSYDTLAPLHLSEERIPAAEEMNWWAANASQVENATCRAKLPTATKDILNYYAKKPMGPGYEGGHVYIGGILLEDERPELVLALAKLLSPARDQSIEGTPKNFQEAFNVNPECKKAMCAAQKIFGAAVGPQMMYLMEQFDVNTSRYSFKNADAFSSTEIADVIRVFELIRPEQIPFQPNKQLIKFKRGYTRAAYGSDGDTVLANASIELFDSWSRQSSIMRQYTLYHEVAHNYSDNHFSDYDRSNAWLALSNWKENTNGEFEAQKRKAQQGHPFVSRYGETNPFEDFAESVTAYRFNPALLKKASPDKYNLIKLLVFDGLEFTSNAACSQPTLKTQYQKQVDAGVSFSHEQKEAIKNSCRQSYYQSIVGRSPVSFFANCVDYEATQVWQKQNINKFPGLVPQSLYDEKLRISNLKFKGLKKELVQELAPEAADWILEVVKIYTYRMKPEMTNSEYCDVWAEIKNRVYPSINIQSEWRRNSYLIVRDYSPNEGAARGLCLDLVQGFTPRSKSTVSSIKSWVKEKALIESQEPLQERGITRDTLLKYILDRTDLK
ncbi:hypothetical protein AZI87_05490 [Bdellovibrio bacteriovorus]|uniref:Lipoprotein n=1 Tax=Bdellovibrio bacteriovorus TaxID=959 RepID=A0A161PTM0_BDEBC|nr:hypothetical protein [Bdellovibrio bacteriovorus]KYG68688.1 hypothetical protein AZI87_05490 [Bdellovibrio bacteriovorus]